MKKQLSALLAAALCAGALAGCGANSNSANAATSGAEDTVTLAVVSPVTGDSAEYGIHFNVGAQMAADKINEAGGINGKQVVLKSFDSKNDAKEAAEVARLICQDKTILATIGDFSSTCCMATAPIYEENKTVQISPSAGLIDFPRVGPYNFSTTGVQENDGGFLMNRVINEKMGAKSVAIVYTNNDYGLNMLSYMTQEAEADGVVITDTEAIASGEKDFTAIVSKMRQTEPEAVAIMGSYNEVANCVKQILSMAIIGGMGTIAGPLVGALLINIVTEAFRFLSEYRMVVYALIIIGMMWLRPQGIAGSSDSVLVSGGSKKGRARRRTAHPKPVQPETEKEG